MNILGPSENKSRLQRNRQRGAALLILMLVVVVLVLGGLLGVVDPESKRVHLQKRTQSSLIEAKEALLAYAVTNYGANPGDFARLPCPDMGIDPNNSREGVQGPGCGTNLANTVGRFPWRTVSAPALKDGGGECLWYAVSGYYQSFANFPLLNNDSPGQLLLYEPDGSTPVTPDTHNNRLVAAVFAPGPPLQGQDRGSDTNTECGGDYNAADFLEAVGVADNSEFSDLSFGIDQIVQGTKANNAINDQVLTISKNEIWDAIDEQYPDDIFLGFTRELARCIAKYGKNHADEDDLRLPWAVPAGSVSQPDWFYNDETNYADQVDTLGGRFPFVIQESANALGGDDTLFVAGDCFEFDDLGAQPPSYPLYKNLWDNWKDHVFYAVSEARTPDSADPSVACGGPGNSCLTVNGNEYAAIVIFGGRPIETAACNPPPANISQTRKAPPYNDDKAETANYLESCNWQTLDNEDGSGDYQYQPGNDLMVCVCESLDCDAGTPEIEVDTDCDLGTSI